MFKVDKPCNSIQPYFTYNRKKHTKPILHKPKTFEDLQGKCFRCGSEYHKANSCKFKNEFCNSCKKLGHLARVCLNQGNPKPKRVAQLQDAENEEEVNHATFDMNFIGSNTSDKIIVNLRIENKPINMELDTGAALSSISYRDFRSMNIDKKIFTTQVQLRTYTGEIIKPKGVTYVRFEFNGKSYFGKLFIIHQNVEPIFGREWLREVNMKIGEIKALEQKSMGLDKLIHEFSDVFEKGIGCITNEKASLHITEGCRPIFVKPRQVPYALKDKVDQELQRLENAGIITKIESSEWGTPIVPILKPNGTVRICADYKTTLNKVIRDENYPIPRIDEIFTAMSGGKIFCTLDISNAYLHMPMDEQSAVMQTISTQNGLYKVNRMMFGIKVAPAIWQRYMDKTLQGMNGVKCFFDDIIVQGSNYQEALSRLWDVLEKLKANNLKVNFEKCKFFQRKIEYLGHTIDENGLHTNKEKVKAVIDAKQPRNLHQLRSFIGLANYYNKFIPRLAELLTPLNELLQKGKKFVWDEKCEHSFKIVKENIAKDSTLAHYDPKQHLVLSTDASPDGLGAVLSHRYKDGTDIPIAFASRSLTKSEKQYSQIDKEATSIYWGVKKFFSYCFGRKFTLITDHKPLVSIFSPSKSLPSMSATRLLNYALFLSGFDYDIQYRRTSEHSNADFLSRFPTEHAIDKDDIYSKVQANQLSVIPVTKDILADHTKRDKELLPILNALEKGECLEKLGFHNNGLFLQGGCIFRGPRVIIPSTFQSEVLKELHIGHLGITKMKALARSYLHWKNMDKDIEKLVKLCPKCIQKKKEPPKENVHPWEEPSAPWQRVHIDFFELKRGQHFFIIVDSFSKWVDVIATRTTTTDWCIRELRHLFTIFGLPLTLVSDNGPQFTSLQFKTFLKSNGISHRTIAPFHPSSNGQAERFVQFVKNSLHAMEGEPGDIQYKLDRLMTQIRKAPSSTGLSAYTLMFGRDIRTRINTLSERKETHGSTIENKRKLKLHQRVQARSYSSKEKWMSGVITDKLGDVMYKVELDDGRVWTRHCDQIRPL